MSFIQRVPFKTLRSSSNSSSSSSSVIAALHQYFLGMGNTTTNKRTKEALLGL